LFFLFKVASLKFSQCFTSKTEPTWTATTIDLCLYLLISAADQATLA